MQASGSGGTVGGLAVGLRLAGSEARVHAYGVCDDPDYFYDYIDGLYAGLGARPDVVGEPFQAFASKQAERLNIS